MAEVVYERILIQLRLALLSDCGCEDTLSKAEEDARETGLTGAEIDAALTERSFDVRSSAMLAFGCALKHGDLAARTKAEAHAIACGWTRGELNFVKDFVHQLVGLDQT